MSVFASLEQFDDTFTVPTGRKIENDLVPDGTYEVEIGKAEMAETEKSKETIFKMPLHFATGGIAGDYVERAYFFRGQEGYEKFIGDLKVLGFPVHEWVKGHPSGKKASAEIPKAVEAMRGLRLKITKSSRKDKDGKLWHNLHIVERMGPTPAALPAGEYVPATGAADTSYNPDSPF